MFLSSIINMYNSLKSFSKYNYICDGHPDTPTTKVMGFPLNSVKLWILYP